MLEGKKIRRLRKYNLSNVSKIEDIEPPTENILDSEVMSPSPAEKTQASKVPTAEFISPDLNFNTGPDLKVDSREIHDSLKLSEDLPFKGMSPSVPNQFSFGKLGSEFSIPKEQVLAPSVPDRILEVKKLAEFEEESLPDTDKNKNSDRTLKDIIKEEEDDVHLKVGVSEKKPLSGPETPLFEAKTSLGAEVLHSINLNDEKKTSKYCLEKYMSSEIAIEKYSIQPVLEEFENFTINSARQNITLPETLETIESEVSQSMVPQSHSDKIHHYIQCLHNDVQPNEIKASPVLDNLKKSINVKGNPTKVNSGNTPKRSSQVADSISDPFMSFRLSKQAVISPSKKPENLSVKATSPQTISPEEKKETSTFVFVPEDNQNDATNSQEAQKQEASLLRWPSIDKTASQPPQVSTPLSETKSDKPQPRENLATKSDPMLSPLLRTASQTIMAEKEKMAGKSQLEKSEKEISIKGIQEKDSSVHRSELSARGGAKSNRSSIMGKDVNIQKLKANLEESVSNTRARRGNSFTDIDDSKSVKSAMNEAKMKKRIGEQFPSGDVFENESGKSQELNDFQTRFTQVSKNGPQSIINPDNIRRASQKRGCETLHQGHGAVHTTIFQEKEMSLQINVQPTGPDEKSNLMDKYYPRLALIMMILLLSEFIRRTCF